MEKSFHTEELVPVNDTEKGKNTWEWHLADGHQITVYKRAKGMEFGDHFHTGEDASKNPEHFLLIYGQVLIIFEDISGAKIEKILDGKNGPTSLIIQPMVYHSMIALTDCEFIEYRPTVFDPLKPDSHPRSEFDPLRNMA